MDSLHTHTLFWRQFSSLCADQSMVSEPKSVLNKFNLLSETQPFAYIVCVWLSFWTRKFYLYTECITVILKVFSANFSQPKSIVWNGIHVPKGECLVQFEMPYHTLCGLPLPLQKEDVRLLFVLCVICKTSQKKPQQNEALITGNPVTRWVPRCWMHMQTPKIRSELNHTYILSQLFRLPVQSLERFWHL